MKRLLHGVRLILHAAEDDGDVMTWDISTQPTNGTAVVSGSGSSPTNFTYTPNPDFYGSDSFVVSVSDIDGNDTITVNVTVNPINDKPSFTALGNPPTVNEDAGTQTISGWLTSFTPGPANESGQMFLSATVPYVSNPALFEMPPMVDSSYTLKYTPAVNAFGTSTFVVIVSDNGGTANGGSNVSDGQTFTVTVNPVNDAPVITGQNPLSTNEDTSLTLTLSNLTVSDIDNTYPTGFTLIIPSGTNYTVLGNTITPNLNFNGALTVYVKVKDGVAESNLFNLSVTVNPVDDPPTVANPIADITVNEDAPDTVIDLTNVFTDIDNDITAIFKTIPSNSNPALVSANLTGSILTLSYKPNQSGTAEITIRGKSNGKTADDTFIVKVNSGIDPLIVANPIADVTVNEDAKKTTIDLSKVFSDPDDEDSAIIKTVFTNSNPSLVSASINSDILTLVYQPNQNGTSDITIQGTSNGKTADDTFFVTVNPVDDPPTVANPIADVTVDEDAASKVIDLTSVFKDIDNTEIIKTISPNSNLSVVSANISGDILTLVYQPDQNGTAEITIRGTSNEKTADDTFKVTVKPVDDPPTVTNPIADVTVNEDSPNTVINLSNLFKDVDNTEIIKTILPNSNPAMVSDTITGNILTLVYQPDQNGIAEITVQGKSGGKTAEDIFLVTVLPEPDPPYFISSPLTRGFQDTPYLYNITADDPDGDIIVINVSVKPEWLSFTENGDGTAVLTGTPVYNQIGTYNVELQVSDGTYTANQSFVITVKDTNDAPVLDNTGNMMLNLIDEDIENTYNIGTSVANIIASAGGDRITDYDEVDEEGIAVIAVKNENGKWQYKTDTQDFWKYFPDDLAENNAMLLEDTAFIRFVPTPDYNGTIENGITFRAWDRHLGNSGGTTADTTINGGTTAFSISTESASVTVNAVNDPPVIAEGESVSVEMSEDGFPNPFSLILHAKDADNNTLKWQIISKPQNGIADVGNSGSVSYTPESNYNGTESFTVQVGDGSSTDSVIVNVIIISVNDVPIAMSLSNASVSENSPVGTEVGIFSVTDSDNEDKYSYTMTAGTSSDDNSAFLIDGNRLKTADVFDYEIKNKYYIRVRYDDGNGGILSKRFVIDIVNQIEVSAKAEPEFLNFTVIEGESDPEPQILKIVNTGDGTLNWEYQPVTPVLTACSDGTAVLWNGETGEKIRIFRHSESNPVTWAAFSHDGSRIVTAGWDKRAVVWDIQTGERLLTLNHDHSVLSAEFSPDGKRILTANNDYVAVLWDAETGERIMDFKGHTGYVYAASFGPDGKYIVTGGYDTKAILWDTESGEKIRIFGGHTHIVCSAVFSPDGNQILTAGFDKTAILQDTETGEIIRIFSHDDVVRYAVFSPDGKKILTAGYDGKAVIWDIQTGEIIRIFSHENSVRTAMFSPDGKEIVTSDYDSSVSVWNAETGEIIRSLEYTGSAARSVSGSQRYTSDSVNESGLWELEFFSITGSGQRAKTGVRLTNAVFSPIPQWLFLSRTSGSAEEEADEISVSAKTAGLKPGVYYYPVMIETDAALLEIPATLTVISPAVRADILSVSRNTGVFAVSIRRDEHQQNQTGTRVCDPYPADSLFHLYSRRS